MEIPPHCTVSGGRVRADLLAAGFFTGMVLLVHGFHPWAEDGGLYVAGVEYLLQPGLFPHDRAFVLAPMRFSLFAPLVAELVRVLHLPLADVLLGLYLLTTYAMLLAALRLARRCFPASTWAAWPAAGLLTALWTLPVAGTSLLLMDPYLTARSFSTPLTLWAIEQALAPTAGTDVEGRLRRSDADRLGRIVLLLASAACLHPLMAIYGALFAGLVAMARHGARSGAYAAFTLATFACACSLQALSGPETAAAHAAALSRYYWFLSQWHWFELLGLIAPPLVLVGLGQASRRLEMSNQHRTALNALALASVVGGILAVLLSFGLAREHYSSYAVARLQPLRLFLPIYALLPIVLGGLCSAFLQRTMCSRPQAKGLLVGTVAITALAMFAVQWATFPVSPHIEWPYTPNGNPWVQAFLWIRHNTPRDALFALDARYVNTPGEDAQGFRALAERSALPDFSKDGGEAANFPTLAPAWSQAAAATAGLSRLTDAQRAARLQGFGADWLLLATGAHTTLPCPYQNAVVKVCHLGKTGLPSPPATPATRPPVLP